MRPAWIEGRPSIQCNATHRCARRCRVGWRWRAPSSPGPSRPRGSPCPRRCWRQIVRKKVSDQTTNRHRMQMHVFSCACLNAPGKVVARGPLGSAHGENSVLREALHLQGLRGSSSSSHRCQGRAVVVLGMVAVVVRKEGRSGVGPVMRLGWGECVMHAAAERGGGARVHAHLTAARRGAWGARRGSSDGGAVRWAGSSGERRTQSWW